MKQILRDITQEQLKKRTPFKVGDGIKVHTRVREGDKERIQIFSGIVISKRGTGIQEMFTVRRIASGVGVERVFPLHSPNVEKIEMDREAVVSRARMYFIRDRIGKEATQVNEKRLAEAAKAPAVLTDEAKAKKAAKAEAAAAAKATAKATRDAAKKAKEEAKAAKAKAAPKSEKKADKKADKKAEKKPAKKK